MSKKRKLLPIIIFCFSFASLILFDVQQVVADDPLDYYTEIDNKGGIYGSIFHPDKPMIRPEYQGATWEDILKDVTDESGTPLFKGFGESNKKNYKVGDVVYYNNVGIYNKRKLSLKINYITGGNGGTADWKYIVYLNEDGSLSQKSAGIKEDVEGLMSYQLVYTDDKQVVKDVYLEFPQVIYIKQGGDRSPSFNTISKNGLKKVYLNLIAGGYTGTKLDFFVGENKKDEMLSMSLSTLYNERVPQNYVIVSDNNEAITIGAYSAFSYSPKFNIFSSSIEAPGTPSYSPPAVRGQSVKKGLAPEYNITQSLGSAYEKYYPEKLSIILEDKEAIFPTAELPSIQVFNRNGESITSKVKVQRLTTRKVVVELPDILLKELKSNSVTIKVKYNDLNLLKIMKYYDSSSDTFNIPLSASNIRKTGTEEVSSDTETGSSKLIPTISATPVEQTVWINSSTNDLDPTQLLKNIESSLPNDRVNIVGFTEEKVFNTVKKDSVQIKLQSQQLSQITKVVEVPINVIDEVVTTDFFENQPWIINNINSQLSPKKIGKDVYLSDLDKIKQINTDTTRPFPEQHIPKNIKYFQNLELLYLRNTKMIGTLPEELGQLRKMKDLRIFDNSLTGEIPKQLGNLKDLGYLILDRNGLTGTVPKELVDLPKLHTLYLEKNKLVGQLPDFRDNFKILIVSENQITHNSSTVPSFLKTAIKNDYAQTFIGEMKLIGKDKLAEISPDTTEIKPFDPVDSGYFSLMTSTQQLHAEHEFTIIDEETDEILYEGKADERVEIPYKKGIIYKVIMDHADKNPKNQWLVKTKIPELKLESVPSSMAFSIPLGRELTKPVQLTGNVSVFDNRDKGNWQLSMTPSALNSDAKTLKGTYSYIDSKGEHSIVTGQKVIIEKGQSDTENEVIPISNKWTDQKGLQFTLNGSNYLGKYQGSVTWTLEDVPN
ncbi:hypothetical protein UAW_03013 [Enterococcus haemoperoxidus ATCC BAA-382]|uniref:WxL domain-containing protein n=1 Tax=Enterococcus haemoperoxidus ATCC BAA-382 TaxID=1158608 RepID=R2QB98_9ENTE|nr:hypothetical protein [Enterococcus haemoperoxidus]EOH92493.1 hypothetical protein UAW_03013 [Enterococcus haemoperoxidus ATCC BAA-382]EOT61714.1 hypothetical protein I583_00696 [Enterococcus haemoperoxidus ATCC BAA-382]OJG51820.1 hypothetical protein RV06_GL001512 [Enterococcus haemoperoxidus]